MCTSWNFTVHVCVNNLMNADIHSYTCTIYACLYIHTVHIHTPDTHLHRQRVRTRGRERERHTCALTAQSFLSVCLAAIMLYTVCGHTHTHTHRDAHRHTQTDWYI